MFSKNGVKNRGRTEGWEKKVRKRKWNEQRNKDQNEDIKDRKKEKTAERMRQTNTNSRRVDT